MLLHGDHLQVQLQLPAAVTAVLVAPPPQVDVDLRDEEGLRDQERPARDHARRARDEALQQSIKFCQRSVLAFLTKWALGWINADVCSVREMFGVCRSSIESALSLVELNADVHRAN